MPIKMIATRAYYDIGARTEYPAGAMFTVASEEEASRLERRRKARRAEGGNVVGSPPPPPVQNGGPFDHDGNGNPGGSAVPEGDEAEIKALRAQYKEVLGKAPFNGWDADELRNRMNTYRTRHLTAGE